MTNRDHALKSSADQGSRLPVTAPAGNNAILAFAYCALISSRNRNMRG
jgi:hypothetical protein